MALKINWNQLKADLELDEGKVRKPYKDTVGKLTIGIGRNLDDVGLSDDEIYYLLNNDISSVERDLELAFPWINEHPESVQRALANMAFNLGLPRLRGFKRMLAAIKEGRYEDAAIEALDSKWATQVGKRALRIAALIRGEPFVGWRSRIDVV